MPPQAISAEPGRFQVMIGLDDLPEPVLQAAVATVGVRVQTLDQLLVPRLDFGSRLGPVKVERVERAAGEIAERSLRFRRFRARPAAVRAEEAERVDEGVLPA